MSWVAPLVAKHRLCAHAKINLSLRLPRGLCTLDGLHQIESEIVFLDLHDRLEVHDRDERAKKETRKETRKERGLAVVFYDAHGEVLSFGARHSLERAARALGMALGAKSFDDLARSLGFSWDIVVRKAIPAGAGLGGGSSDAATFLCYARTRLAERGVSLSEDRWLVLAREVGSDVALFFSRGDSSRVFVSGTGEQVSKRESLPCCGVVLLCGASLSTAAVYECYDRLRRSEETDSGLEIEEKVSGSCVESSAPSELALLLEGTGNDLYSAACALDASVFERLSALRSCEGVFCARMTGSGSACFGLTALGYEEGVAEELSSKGWENVLATRFCA